MTEAGDLAVVWDMGGVFNRYFTQVMVDVGREAGWPLDRLPLGPTGDTADPDYEAMCRGDIEEGEYLSRCLERLRAEGIDFDPRTDVVWADHQRPATWSLIRDLHEAGRTQGILTNDASKWKGDHWWETWDSAHLFTAVVDVATLGVRKPHPDTYRAACTGIDRDPQTCLFVDDMIVNCNGAEAIGMQSLLFDITDPTGSITRLRERIELT